MLQIKNVSNTYFRERKEDKSRGTPRLKATDSSHVQSWLQQECEFAVKVRLQHTIPEACTTICCCFDFINIRRWRKLPTVGVARMQKKKKWTEAQWVLRLAVDQVQLLYYLLWIWLSVLLTRVTVGVWDGEEGWWRGGVQPSPSATRRQGTVLPELALEDRIKGSVTLDESGNLLSLHFLNCVMNGL